MLYNTTQNITAKSIISYGTEVSANILCGATAQIGPCSPGFDISKSHN